MKKYIYIVLNIPVALGLSVLEIIRRVKYEFFLCLREAKIRIKSKNYVRWTSTSKCLVCKIEEIKWNNIMK